MSRIFLTFALTAMMTSTVLADEPESLWDLDFSGYAGGAVTTGQDRDPGMVLGVDPKLTYEGPKRGMLVYAQVTANGFGNKAGGDEGLEMGKLYVRLAAMLGPDKANWKYVFPSLKFGHDQLINETFAGRIGLSGLYLKVKDNTMTDDELKQKLEVITELVWGGVIYDKTGNENVRPPEPRPCTPEDPACKPYEPQEPYAYKPSERQIHVFSLAAALKYIIEKNGWGGQLEAELLQTTVLPTSYSKLSTAIRAFKRLGDKGSPMHNLKFYAEAQETVVHDQVAGIGSWITATQGFIGIAGTIGK